MLAELVGLFAAGKISRSQAKEVLDESLREQKWPRDIVEEQNLSQVSDEEVLAQAIEDVLAANPGFIDEYRAADDKLKKKKQGFVMGQVRDALDGKANMQVLTRLLAQRLVS